MGLFLLSVLSDGRDHETLSRGSGAVFWTSQVSVLQTLEVALTDRRPDARDTLQTTSQTAVQVAQSF